jgi:hypothetical protein
MKSTRNNLIFTLFIGMSVVFAGCASKGSVASNLNVEQAMVSDAELVPVKSMDAEVSLEEGITDTVSDAPIIDSMQEISAVEGAASLEVEGSAEESVSSNQYGKVIIAPLMVEQSSMDEILTEQEIKTMKIKFYSTVQKKLSSQWAVTNFPENGALKLTVKVHDLRKSETFEETEARNKLNQPISLENMTIEFLAVDSMTGETIWQTTLQSAEAPEELTDNVVDWQGIETYITYWASVIAQNLNQS